jgi:hypothetical protein
VKIFRPFEEAQHDLSTTLVPSSFDDRVEGIVPLRGLLRILISVIDRVRILIVYRHLDLFLVETDRFQPSTEVRLRLGDNRLAESILGVGFLLRCARALGGVALTLVFAGSSSPGAKGSTHGSGE